jgi:hypothetical protein
MTGGSAVVADPRRNPDWIEEILSGSVLTRAVTAASRIHNDYGSGSRELALRTGARYDAFPKNVAPRSCLGSGTLTAPSAAGVLTWQIAVLLTVMGAGAAT